MSTATATQIKVPAGEWTVDPVHSRIGYEVRHMDVSTFSGEFSAYEARLGGGETPSLRGTVEVASIVVDDEQLRGHLLSPEFFDLERFGELRFESSGLVIADDGAAELTGALEIRGERREVSASGRYAHTEADIGGSPRIGLTLETAIDRREFGLDWQAELPSGGDVLDWEVRIVVALEFTPATA